MRPLYLDAYKGIHYIIYDMQKINKRFLPYFGKETQKTALSQRKERAVCRRPGSNRYDVATEGF